MEMCNTRANQRYDTLSCFNAHYKNAVSVTVACLVHMLCGDGAQHRLTISDQVVAVSLLPHHLHTSVAQASSIGKSS